jgi:hypothetical protein
VSPSVPTFHVDRFKSLDSTILRALSSVSFGATVALVVRPKRSCAHSTRLSKMSRSGYAEPMVTWIIDVVRLLIVLTSRHRALALENLALRQQLALYRRTRPKPIMPWPDRLFWIGLRAEWGEWKSALVVIRPATVVACV